MSYYYNLKNNNVTLIGVTGTDGKTTTSLIARNLLNSFSKTAYLGTNGFYINEAKYQTKNTTPSLDKILFYLNKTKKLNNENLIMEVSSEGLIKNRCYNLSFDYAILTNISTDHLNIHKNIKEYLNAKKMLFKQVKETGFNILNIDDKYFKEIKKISSKNIATYGANKKADYYFFDVELKEDKTFFNLKIKKEIYKIESPFLGLFNVYNLVAAIALLNTMNIPIEKIIPKIKNLDLIDGRLNHIDFKQNYKIIVDYAHTTNATSQILEFLNTIKKNKIIIVVGCAGQRDSTKRKDIGKIVSENSDYVIFTTDDPRYENPKDIVNEMLLNVSNNNYEIILDRKSAIEKALKIAEKDDIVVILGKGLDNYIAIEDKYISYSDYAIIKNYFSL